MLVQYGTLLINVALLNEVESLTEEIRFPSEVFITKEIFFEFNISTIWGDPSLTLLTFLHLIPFFLIIFAVPSVPQSVKFNSTNFFAKFIPSS